MTEIIYLPQSTAAEMTTFKELIKLYTKKNPLKYEEAIEANKAKYKSAMDELLGRNEEAEKAVAA